SLGRGVPAVIDGRLQPENFRHHVVDIHVLERLDDFSLLERRSMRDEERAHGFELVVEAVHSTKADSAARRFSRPVTLPTPHRTALVRNRDDVAYPRALAVMKPRRQFLLSIDFHPLRRLGFQRRINLLLYFGF